MADPLSIAASIAGLLTLAGSIIPKGYALCSRLSGRNEDIRVLMNEVTSLSGLIFGLQAHANSTASTRSPLTPNSSVGSHSSLDRVIRDCRELLLETTALLDEIAKRSNLRLVFQKDFVTDRVGSLMPKIERYKSLFILFFQAQNDINTAEIRKTTIEMATRVRDIQTSQNLLQSQRQEKQDATKRAKVLDWLGQVTEAEHEEATRYRLTGSGQWLLHRPEFEIWASADNSSFFWLNGIRGSGKTVLVSAVIQALREIYKADSGNADVVVVYHYCKFSDSSLPTERLIGALAVQVLQQSNGLADGMASAVSLFERHQYKFGYPDIDDMAAFFQQITVGLTTTFIVIDGLDEIVERELVIAFLDRVTTWDGNFKVFVASRKSRELEQGLGYFNSLTLTQADIEDDIERYARYRISRFRWPDIPELDEIVQELVHRADGMFLWVVCQLDNLSRARTTINKGLLKTLPKGLGKTFEAILLNLEEDDKHLARRTLQLISCSRHPLDLDELVEAVAIEPSMPDLSSLRRNKLRRATDVFDICGSLIRRSEVTGRLALCHSSVDEFLSSATLSSGRPNDFFIDVSSSNTDLALACITYLNFAEFSAGLTTSLGPSSGETLIDSPFLDYASRSWPYHLARAGNSTLENLWPVLQEFFDPKRGNFGHWASIMRYTEGEYAYPCALQPLHAAAMYGLQSLAEKLLEMEPNCIYNNVADSRTALHLAMENRQSDMISFLIDHGSPLQAADAAGRQPLHLAMELGNVEAVELLILYGSDINAALPDGRTPVTIAIENKWCGLMAILGKSSAKTKLDDGRTLLHLSAQSENEECAEFLLGLPEINVNAEDRSRWTALHYATNNGDERIVKALLKKGACALSRDSRGWTPLHAAVRGHYTECLSLLLKAAAGADRNATAAAHRNATGESSRAGRRPIETSAESGSEQQSDLDRRKYGLTSNQWRLRHGSASAVPSPLLLAVSDGYYQGVRVLLEYSDIKFDFGQKQSMKGCLEKAAQLPELDIFKALLSNATTATITEYCGSTLFPTNSAVLDLLQAHFGLEDGPYHQVICRAVESGNVDAVSHFVGDPSSQTNMKVLQDMFRRAIVSDKVEIAQLLARNGAQPALADSTGRTLLMYALQHGNYKASRYLCDTGVSCPIARTDDGKSALHILAYHCNREIFPGCWLEIADMLKQQGANITAVDENGHDILFQAIAGNNLPIAVWCLKNGLHLNTQGDGDRAFNIAVASQHFKMVRLVLGHMCTNQPKDLLDLMADKSGDGKRGILVRGTRVRQITLLELLLDFERQACRALGDSGCTLELSRCHTEAICAAVSEGFIEGVSSLLSHTKNLLGFNSDGETALHCAARHGKQEAMTLLLQAGGNVDEATLTNDTVLSLAIKGGHAALVNFILQNGAVIRHEDMATAAMCCDVSILKGLLQSLSGTERHQMAMMREAALASAIAWSQHEVLQVLLAYGTDILPKVINQAGPNGTVLHLAVECNDKDLVTRILNCNIGISCIETENAHGETAAHVAAKQHSKEIVAVLFEAGANLDKAISWAVQNKQFESIMYLKMLVAERTKPY